MQKLLISAVFFALAGTAAQAQNYGNSFGHSTNNYGNSFGTGSNPSAHYVQPYQNSYGGTTEGHYQTNPNSTQYDNYGSRGNVNPYTGAVGTRTPRY